MKQIDLDGTYEYYNTIAEVDASVTTVNNETLPTEFSLSQNYPNPFNPSTTIKYTIPLNEKQPAHLGRGETSNVKLIVFDILGNEIATLVNETKGPGTYQVEFNAKKYSSGIYFYKLSCSNFNTTRKMILIK